MSIKSHLLAGVIGAVIALPVTAIYEKSKEMSSPPGALRWQATERSNHATDCYEGSFCSGGVSFYLENYGNDPLSDTIISFRSPVDNAFRDPAIPVQLDESKKSITVTSIPSNSIVNLFVVGVQESEIASVLQDGEFIEEGEVQIFGQRRSWLANQVLIASIVAIIISTLATMAGFFSIWVIRKEIEKAESSRRV